METGDPNVPALIFGEEVRQYLSEEWSSGNVEVPEYGGGPMTGDFYNLLTWLASPPKFTTLRMNFCKVNGKEDTAAVLAQIVSAISSQYEESGQPPPKCNTHPKINDLLIIPNEGPRKLEEREKEVMVGLGCGVAVLRGADVYAQGIMAAPSHLAIGDCVSVYADVEGEVRKGLMKKFTGRRVFVGNGVATMDRQQLFSSGGKSSGLAIRMTDPLYLAPSLSGLLPSLIFPQNLPSSVCSHVLEPQPGETILDMCAAPGGKTTHIAALMKNQGRVVALDKSKGKIKSIQNNAASWDLSCIEAYHYDGTKALQPEAEKFGPPPFPPALFDRIMLDAPCSALGQRPSFRNTMKLTEVKSYPPLQKNLFTTAWSLLRSGGTLVYSTCSWTMEENEKLVAWALKTFNDITLQPQEHSFG